MNAAEHFLISLEPRHAQKILAGEKHVELRRRSMNVAAGATMWIYAKLPIGSIVGHVTIGAVEASSPDDLWKRYGTVSGLTKFEFFNYFEGRETGVALVLGARSMLEKTLSLTDLREVDNGFHPPQFFTRLEPSHPVRHAVMQASARAVRRKKKHAAHACEARPVVQHCGCAGISALSASGTKLPAVEFWWLELTSKFC